MLAGDSAGGHILLSVISHILHPHPSAPALRVTSPFRCTILISPAVAAKGTSSSMQENGYLDIINQALVYRWFDMLMEATPFEEEVKAGKFWGTSLEAPVEWWNGLTTAVQKVFLTTGQCEILKDDIIAFGEKLQTLEELNRVEGLKVFIGENEIHDAPLDDFSFGRGFSGSTKMFAQWATEAFNDST